MLVSVVERPSASSFIQEIWCSQSERPGTFISTANIHGEIVFTRDHGKTMVTVRGPETKATTAAIPAHVEWLGITFRLGTFMPGFPPYRLIDRQDVSLPQGARTSFWLDGSTWELPTYENAETFVNRLVRAGLLMRDPLVDDILNNIPTTLSARSLQVRFHRATGMTYKTVQQIQRAQQAAEMLAQGCPILDTAYQLGYFDQSHLTNSLRRFLGQTPTQISRALQPS